MKYFLDLTPEIEAKKGIRSRGEIFLGKGRVVGAEKVKLIFEPHRLKKISVESKNGNLTIRLPAAIWNIVRPQIGKRIKYKIKNVLRKIIRQPISLWLNSVVKMEKDSKVIWFNFTKFRFKDTQTKSISSFTTRELHEIYKNAFAKSEDLFRILQSLSKYNLVPGKYLVCFWRDYSESKKLIATLKNYHQWLSKKMSGKKCLLFIGPASPTLIKKFKEKTNDLSLSNYAYLITDLAEKDLKRIVSASGGFVRLEDDSNRLERIEAELVQVPEVKIH